MSYEAVRVDPDIDYITPGALDLEQMFWTGIGATYTHCNQVWPNLYIGDEKTAMQRPGLEEMGVTHIINAAAGMWNNVSTGPDYYRDMNIVYYGIEADDTPTFNLSPYFYPAAHFISQALTDTHNKVLVHCVLGRSRSVTLVLAYMMIEQRLTLVDAIGHVRQRRCVLPNRGFLKQLRDLDLKLQEDRLRD